MILAESLNDPRVLAESDDCLFSPASLLLSSGHLWGPSVQLQLLQSRWWNQPEKRVPKNHLERFFSTADRWGFFTQWRRSLPGTCWPVIQGEWDCLDSAPFKHSCTRKFYGLAAVGHLVYFACTMTLKMGHLHKACQVFQVRFVPRPCTHLWSVVPTGDH